MPKIQYKECRFQKSSQNIINQANNIINEYMAKGFQLTLRQLFYQFVSRDLLKNTQKNYKRLGDIISNARLDGQIDWNAIVDRTRFLRKLAHWDTPADIISSCAPSFHVDMWEHQVWRPEVWIEKDALVGVFEGVCNEYDVPMFSCRGYTSQSEMWAASNRIYRHVRNGQKPIILHFGDHDPSGLDMSRDIEDRLNTFIGTGPLTRMALNMDQVEEYEPPPNSAKMSDSRAEWYVEEFDTTDSWELDALDPETLASLVKDKIETMIDRKQWETDELRREVGREQLQLISTYHEKVAKFVTKLDDQQKKRKKR